MSITLKERLPKDVRHVGDYSLFRQFTGQVPVPYSGCYMTGKSYPIRAMRVQGGNPALTLAQFY